LANTTTLCCGSALSASWISKSRGNGSMLFITSRACLLPALAASENNRPTITTIVWTFLIWTSLIFRTEGSYWGLDVHTLSIEITYSFLQIVSRKRTTLSSFIRTIAPNSAGVNRSNCLTGNRYKSESLPQIDNRYENFARWL
jgi:hypothetical protein